ncbi:hypothetical protein ACIBSR_13425 [Streptomyces sp. NPDC049936]|uniref:hypothetical protein n=1 Tax=Streptomyces sp. NPDC049936 TaxID=3365599 RepID=UPI0037A69D69
MSSQKGVLARVIAALAAGFFLVAGGNAAQLLEVTEQRSTTLSRRSPRRARELIDRLEDGRLDSASAQVGAGAPS